MNHSNELKLANGLIKLRDKIDRIKYISSIKSDKNNIYVIYGDGSNDVIALDANTFDYDEVDKRIRRAKEDLNDDLGSLFSKVSKLKEEAVNNNIDKSQLESIKKDLNNLTERLDNTDKLINLLRDNSKIAAENAEKTADPELNEDSLAEFKRYIDEAISKIKVVDGKDGTDGKDGQSVNIDEVVNIALGSIKKDFDSLALSLKNEAKKVHDSLPDSFSNLESSHRQLITDTLNKAISSVPAPRDGADGKDGVDGKDGKDADEEAIKATILEEINLLLEHKVHITKEELRLFILELVAKIPRIKGDKGDKGDRGQDGESIKGDKGKPGNGVRSASINPSGDLIIITDEKVINAGQVKINKFYGGGGGGEIPKYTNTKPIPFNIGGYPAGTRFDKVDMRVLWTKLFYGFDLPEFDTFYVQDLSHIDIGGVFEVGYKIAAGDYLFNFNIVNPELLEENTIFVEHDGTIIAEKLQNLSPVTLPIIETTKTTLGKTTFRIAAFDTTGVTFQKDYECEFRYRIFYGEYTEDIQDTGLPNPFIVLRATELVNNIQGEYHFLGIAYKWFCYPENLGENYVFYELTSDIAIVFDDVKKITITNEYGLEITYNCYRTLNEINQDFTMVIK